MPNFKHFWKCTPEMYPWIPLFQMYKYAMCLCALWTWTWAVEAALRRPGTLLISWNCRLSNSPELTDSGLYVSTRSTFTHSMSSPTCTVTVTTQQVNLHTQHVIVYMHCDCDHPTSQPSHTACHRLHALWLWPPNKSTFTHSMSRHIRALWRAYIMTATNHDRHKVYHDGYSNENVKN